MAINTTQEHLLKFGHHLKGLRLSKGLSLRKLAARCNIDHSDIIKYEKGQVNMSFNSLIELSNGLEISLKELMDY